jgi:PAS domain S-box-containing protein
MSTGAANASLESNGGPTGRHPLPLPDFNIFREAIEPHAFLLLLEDGRVVRYANEKTERLLGLRAGEIRGRTLDDLRKLGLRLDAEGLQNSLERGSRWTGELVVIAADGTRTWIVAAAVPASSAPDQPRQMSLVGYDITPQMQAQEALRLSEDRLQTVLQNLTEGIVVADGEGKILYWNRAGLEMHGFADQKEGQKSVASFVGVFEMSDLDGRVLSYDEWPLPRLFRGEDVADMTVRVRRLDSGIERIFRYSGSRINDTSGKPLALLAITDITARKLAEDALIATNTRYDRQESALAYLTRMHRFPASNFQDAQREITEVAARTLGAERLGIWRHNPARRVFQCLDQYDSAADRHSAGLVVEEEQFRACLDTINQEGLEAQETVHPKKSGAARFETMDVPVHLHRNTAGVMRCERKAGEGWKPDEQTFAVAVANLVSLLLSQAEQRKFEEKLRQTQKMEAVGQLAGGIAHDFNNILGSIVGYTGLARMECKENPTLSRYLDQISQASNRATELVKQVLVFSRRRGQERKPLALAAIVEEALKLLRASVPSTIAFEVQIDDPPVVLANPTAVHQVITNLGTNAWHAMRTDGGTLRIELRRFEVDAEFCAANPELQPGCYARLSISDTGHGMDAATAQRVFEPFFTTKAPGEGTGLGLAVVHGIMQGHDGAVSLYSQPGEGTTFHLYFPAHDAQAELPPEEVKVIPRGNGERILFIDDERPLVELGERMLTHLGYSVTALTSSMDSVALFERDPSFDVVITDLTMPGMDGIRVAQRLHEIRSDVRIILTTGYSGAMHSDHIKELGVRAVLIKPNTMRSLGETVNAVLQED